ncbi:MAG: hypothetical protein KA715_14350 [Xanthomonadaceae bacterium]|nr:hypothetical protein [Xanthomonadaceae bacterium]
MYPQPARLPAFTHTTQTLSTPPPTDHGTILIAAESFNAKPILDMPLLKPIRDFVLKSKSPHPALLTYKDKDSGMHIILMQGKSEEDFARIVRVMKRNYAFPKDPEFREVYDN